ncbi:GntR family transcriptional regulator [Tamaricihabitans halophyticus]|uniref:GntR family transcriptional regulator n=1 Tax=Tamaricihabitans halophyticus TaxID=1262583 RepID=A0A4R2QT41_9PSEU|nr:FadR/GntR family transcriptional regulator [Tamaricihabitans halophyticus]TCP53080.1 GntR family transcriptional regulator [Tamaricihabitans halophyticus]
MSESTEERTGLRVHRVQAAYRQVAEQLKAQILSGELGAGTRLPNEAELTRLFGVSRSTVREALRLLASQQLVDTTRGATGGTFVSSPDATTVAEHLGGTLGLLVNTDGITVANLLDARLILEPSAARLAAQRAEPEALRALEATTVSTAKLSPSGGFVVHWDFHTTLVAATDNPLLRLMCQPVNAVLHGRLHRERIPREVWDRIDAEHVEIYRAVAEGDADSAEELTRQHLHSLRPLYEQMGAD